MLELLLLFLPGATLEVEVLDGDLNADPVNVETAIVAVQNQSSGESIDVIVTESGPDSDRFFSTLPTQYGSEATDSNGVLDVLADNQIVASYFDSLTADGGQATRTDTIAVAPGGVNGTVSIREQSTAGLHGVRLSWTAPTQDASGQPMPSSEVDGYRIYFGRSADTLDGMLDTASAATEYDTGEIFEDGEWHFAVTAYRLHGDQVLESVNSLPQQVLLRRLWFGR